MIHFDKDDDIDTYEIYRTRGSTFEDSLGEFQASWEMRSRKEVIETLLKVCEVLCTSFHLTLRQLVQIKN